ncbi:hypothetical protein [Brevibacillus laterosporus]|uniref:hypothetical protein n=1 Tax=Brevibacillus laterosporus TaxID=1465 RepID=UPI000E6B911C|nr:hypothetical protein [Brevibacillus laterosporus]AYB37654.1 hypothetical protein D5F52_04785 [Brevibacillus laterosporus]MBG9776086.1 hypothetical protein [Brevibacillus laterosporus]MBM7110907.1 hypothetical protein [Brevibacillus laterosporus]
MKKMIAISFLSLAVVGLSFFPTNVQAYLGGIKDPTNGGSPSPGGGGCANLSGCQCHSLDC